MADKIIDLRCVVCRAEFASADLSEEIMACPACGDSGIPADPREDQLWAVTFTDWHQLASAAMLWEEAFKDEATVIPALKKVIFANDIANEHGEHPVKLSPHEIRILTFWAARHVHQTPEGSVEEESLERVLKAFHAQSRYPLPLTLEEEVDDLRAQGYDATLSYGEE